MLSVVWMIDLFIHILVLCLVMGLAYWLVTLVVGVLPPPVAPIARVILLVLLVFIAISVLLGETGMWNWGSLGYHRHAW